MLMVTTSLAATDGVYYVAATFVISPPFPTSFRLGVIVVAETGKVSDVVAWPGSENVSLALLILKLLVVAHCARRLQQNQRTLQPQPEPAA